MLVAEEVPLQGKQIWCSFTVVDVNDFLDCALMLRNATGQKVAA